MKLVVRQLLRNTSEYPDIRSLKYPDIRILNTDIRCRPNINKQLVKYPWQFTQLIIMGLQAV